MSFGIGSTIIFKLDETKSNDIWFSERVVDFDIERGLVIFETWQIHFQDIIAVRNPDANRFLKTTAVTLKTFGGGLIFFSLVGRLPSKCENCDGALKLGLVVSAVGWVLDWVIPKRLYRIKGNTKLRLIDLTIKKEDVKPALP